MFTTHAILSLSSILSIALAQTSTVSLYIPGADPQGLIGEVIGTASSLTTYVLQCANTEECGFRDPFTVTENVSTAKFTMAPENGDDGVLAFTARIDCSLSPSSSSAVCVESFGGSDANFPGQSTETYTGTDFAYMPVFITAGIGATPSTPASTTPASSAATNKSTSGASGSQTSSGTGAKQTSSSASGTGTAASTATSTAGGSAVTGMPRWVVGGGAVAAVVMMV
ncbi:hypothetical protein VTL71DRAFT_129 [Oculimacula yallundae]|uniref:Uncharacterized protein n=1 Tax=Oculimacula yallundae TaxID=86028 RepID=A0ABR4CZ91_9HELO